MYCLHYDVYDLYIVIQPVSSVYFKRKLHNVSIYIINMFIQYIVNVTKKND